MQITIILDILLVKSGEMTRIIKADPRLETVYAYLFFGCVIGLIID